MLGMKSRFTLRKRACNSRDMLICVQLLLVLVLVLVLLSSRVW